MRKELEATKRVGKWLKLEPRLHVSIVVFVGRILTVAMEIWNHECGPVWPNVAVFAIVCHIGITISPWGKGPSQEQSAINVAYNQGLNTIELRICFSGSSGVI